MPRNWRSLLVLDVVYALLLVAFIIAVARFFAELAAGDDEIF